MTCEDMGEQVVGSVKEKLIGMELVCRLRCRTVVAEDAVVCPAEQVRP
jgi:hypothetical protein